MGKLIGKSITDREKRMSIINMEKGTTIIDRENAMSIIDRESGMSIIDRENVTSIIDRENRTGIIDRENGRGIFDRENNKQGNCTKYPVSFKTNFVYNLKTFLEIMICTFKNKLQQELLIGRSSYLCYSQPL